MYKLNYIDGVKGCSNGFGEVGSLVHSLLERYYNGELEQFELSEKFLEEFDEAVPHGVVLTFENGFRKDLSEQYMRQCVGFLDNFGGFEGYEVIGVEENFSLLVEIGDKKFMLNGFLDLVLKDKYGNYHVIDFKSKSKFKDQNEVDEYSRQLFTYAIYIKHRYGVFPKELRFVQFRIGHTERVKFSEDVLGKTVGWIYRTLEEIEEERFFFPIDFESGNDPTFFCRCLCSYGQNSGICEFYSDYLRDKAVA